MFHVGPINTAITSAIQQDRFLAFFVTDNSDESKKWESVYLRSPEILHVLQSQSILVRLQEGSTEAAFLAAFCPVQDVPYMVVVKNGALIGSIPSDVGSREEFVQRIKSTFPAGSQEQTTPPAPVDPTAALFAERKARLEALEGRRKAQERKERDERIARGKARREAESPARTRYVAEQRKLREDDLAEKQRILRLVENDKIERREKEARKQQAALARRPAVTTPQPDPGPVPSSNETAISFRLLDGSILKSKFASSSKLADVRAWLDQNRTDTPSPYSFQQILPNKSLSASDENSTLRALSFSHATTLVLVHRNE